MRTKSKKAKLSSERTQEPVKLTRSRNEAAAIANHLKSPTLMMLVLIAVFGSLLYASFLFNPSNRGDTLPYVLVIVAETFLLAQALLSLWTVLASGYNPRSFAFYRAKDRLLINPSADLDDDDEPKSKPTTRKSALYLKGKSVDIDVFITTYGEEIEVIRQTAIATRDMKGRHITYILDDGKSDDVKALALDLGIQYIRREDNVNAKAGNVNYALQLASGEYFVIFDADFVPDQSFLLETMPFFESPNIAFVQTPQHYANLNTLVSRGAGYMQHIFYALIQPGKNRFNAAFCVGTNVVFRRSAIDSIGGMYEHSKSEDIWTSILLHEKGYTSVYIPTVLAIGRTPETIKAYCKQQLRWATGGFELLFHHFPFSRKRNLTVDQRLQYFATTIYYFSGIATFCLLILPPLQIFFDLTPVSLHTSTLRWALYYSGFYVMQIIVAFYTMGGFKLETLLLANVSFPIYIQAFLSGLFKRNQPWHVTGRKGPSESPFNYIIPQVMVFVFLLGTSIVGYWKGAYTHVYSVSLFWNGVNTAVLGSFLIVAVNESRRARKRGKATQRALVLDEAMPA